MFAWEQEQVLMVLKLHLRPEHCFHGDTAVLSWLGNHRGFGPPSPAPWYCSTSVPTIGKPAVCGILV